MLQFYSTIKKEHEVHIRDKILQFILLACAILCGYCNITLHISIIYIADFFKYKKAFDDSKKNK